MLNVQKMIESAKECLGWPYVSPGTNDSKGIDCSGLFVKIYRDQGAKIYHGSNTIYRKYCGDKGEITSSTKLVPGMAVFKWNPNTPEKFDDGLGDFQHIGLVISGDPLQIIHASSAAGCVTIDKKIGKWKYWGKLKDVDYGDEPSPEPQPEPDPGPEPTPAYRIGIVHSDNGKPVKLRYRPTVNCTLYDEVPVGSVLQVIKEKDGWVCANYKTRSGWWMMEKFVKIEEESSEDQPDYSALFTVIIEKLTEAEADELVQRYPQAVKTVG